MHIIYQPAEKIRKRQTYQAREHTRIQRTPLFVVVLLLCAMITSLVLIFMPNRTDAENIVVQYEGISTTYDEQTGIRHVVMPGDTLWSLADRYKQHERGKREWIEHIKDVNNLTGSVLHIGDTLIIPLEKL